MKIERQPVLFLLAILWVLVVSGFFANTALACPTCQDGLHGGQALGFAISILFMLSMPLTIVSFWAVTIFRLSKNRILP